MRIAHNIAALNTNRNLAMNNEKTSKSLERLSSGFQINRAGDDAAGLAISEKMRGQIRGLRMAEKNIQDGISLIKTAEGAMNEIHALLQRGRELAVQASNDTNTLPDKQQLQNEVAQINDEINSIANKTEFNGIKLLQGSIASDASTVGSDDIFHSKDELTNALIGYMLETTEHMVYNAYGIGPDPVRDITVEYEEDAVGGTIAWVTTSTYDVNDPQKYTFKLTFDTLDFLDRELWISKDRIVAHEMTHAMMAASGMLWFNDEIPKWFKEGSAEYLAGANERLNADIVRLGAANVAGAIDGPSNTSEFYSAGYAATVFLADKLAGAGSSIKSFMQNLAIPKTFSLALEEIFGNGYDEIALINDFKAGGAAFMQTAYFSTGTGSILNPGANDKDTVPDSPNPVDETSFFNYIWSASTEYVEKSAGVHALTFQIGANSGQGVQMQLPSINTATLGIGMVNLVVSPSASITFFDNAIEKVSSQRSNLGALQNRLEHAYEVNANTAENLQNAESLIRGQDMALEMVQFTKHNIIAQAAQAMLEQANSQPEAVLQLLR